MLAIAEVALNITDRISGVAVETIRLPERERDRERQRQRKRERERERERGG